MSVPLFEDWLGLSEALIAGTRYIYKWTAEKVSESKDLKQKQAVYMLRDAATLVSALHTMHDSVKKIFGRLRLLSPDTPFTERCKLMREINEFANQDYILAHIRQSLRGLENILQKEDELKDSHRELLLHLKGYAGATLSSAHDSYGSPFRSIDELDEFLTRLKNANSTEEIDALKEKAEETIKAFNSKILVHADRVYSDLRADLIGLYPSLSDPGLAISLENFQSGKTP